MNVQHAGARSMLPGIVQGVRALGSPVSGSNWLAFTNYGDKASSCLVFMFDGERRNPHTVAKITDDAVMTRREYRNQITAHGLAPQHVPRPLGTFEVDTLTVLCTEMISGRHLTSSRDQFRHFARLAGCLLSLHQAGGAARVADEPARELLSDVYSRFSALDAGTGLRDYAEHCRRRSADAAMRLVSIPQHGDFRYMNVLVDKHSVGILDWEYYGEHTMPCYDLLCLLLDAFFCESQQRPFDADSAVKFTHPVRAGVQQYFETFSIPFAMAEPLLEWTLFQQFVSSVDLGESSQEKFLHRIALYRDNVSQSRDFLTALLPRG